MPDGASEKHAEHRLVVALAVRLEFAGRQYAGGTLPDIEAAGHCLMAFHVALQRSVATFRGTIVELGERTATIVWGVNGDSEPMLRSARGCAESLFEIETRGDLESCGAVSISCGMETGLAFVNAPRKSTILPVIVSPAISAAQHVAREDMAPRSIAPMPARSAATLSSVRFGPQLASLIGHRQPAAVSDEAARLRTLLRSQAQLDRLGPDLPVFRVLSVIGEADAGTLAAAGKWSVATVRRSCVRLAQKGLLVSGPSEQAGAVAKDGTFSQKYRVSTSRLKRAAISSVPESVRRSYCTAAACHLETDFDIHPDQVTARAIARHASAGGDMHRSFVWWRKAAALASERSRLFEALDCLELALEMLVGSPAAATPEEELDALGHYASVLGAVLGNGAPQVVETYRTCLARCAQLQVGSPDRKFDFLWGLQAAHVVRGEIGAALEINGRLTECAEASGEDSYRLLSDRLGGLTFFLAGDVEAAIIRYKRVLDVYHAPAHASLRFRYASDQKALALAGLAWAQTISGNVHAASAHADEAERFAGELAHAHTSAHVLGVLAARAQLLREIADAERLASEAWHISDANELHYWKAWSRFILGWSLAAAGSADGLATLRAGVSDYSATGSTQALPYALLLLAQTELAAGLPAEAAASISRAERFTRPGGVELYRSEVFRQASHIAAATGRSADAARLARKAYLIAVGQKADLFCGRAIDSLVIALAGDKIGVEALRSAVRETVR